MGKYEISAEEKKVLNKMYLRSHLGPWGFNMVKMMANCFTITMYPALKEVYKDDPAGFNDAVSRSQSFFNTHIVPFSFIAGLTYALEKDKKENGSVNGDTIESIKASLMGPTAGMFDSLFFNCIRIICAGIAIGLAAQGSILGPLLFVIVYHGIQTGLKFWFTRLGYVVGTSFIDEIFESGLLDALTKSASILGTVMVGAMIATNVNVKLDLVFNFQGAETNILTVIDSIFPGILSLILIFILTKLIRKGYKPITLVLGVVAMSLVGALIGIF